MTDNLSIKNTPEHKESIDKKTLVAIRWHKDDTPLYGRVTANY